MERVTKGQNSPITAQKGGGSILGDRGHLKSPVLKSQFWDRNAHLYERLTKMRFRDALVPMGVQLTNVFPGEKVVDLGAGTGAFAVHACHRKGEVTLIDISARMLDFARSRLSGAGHQSKFKCVVGDFYDILKTIPDHSVDVVHAAASLMYLETDDELLQVLQETHRILRPDKGRLVVLNWIDLRGRSGVFSAVKNLVGSILFWGGVFLKNRGGLGEVFRTLSEYQSAHARGKGEVKPRYFQQEQFAKVLIEAGFSKEKINQKIFAGRKALATWVSV